MNLKVGSLFAGVGGICLGFKNAIFNNNSYEMVWANEIDSYACKTYSANFGHTLVEGDIKKILNPELEEDLKIKEQYIEKREALLSQKIDVLTGGFPCQAFSIAGYRKGFDDDRGNLFWSIINMINLLDERGSKPKIIFLENVKNLKSHDNGNTFKTIKSELVKLGYTLKDTVLNTKDFSKLPQNRERIYIVGFLDKNQAEKFDFFSEEKQKQFKIKASKSERIDTIKKVLDYKININQNHELFYTPQKYPNYFVTKESACAQSKKSGERINLYENITEEYEFYQVRRGMYVRKNQNGVCPTLTANMGTGGHNVPLIKTTDGIRKLSPVETFKLQGFPIGKSYTLPKISSSRLYKQAGNAVSVDVITLIATEILKTL